MKLLKKAPEIGSRNGKTKELTQVCISHSDPTDRLISFESRKEDLIAQIAETLWVVGGSRQLKYLSPFLPRAIDYSDDQTVWRAGYGFRIRNYAGEVDQLKEVLNILKTDLYSRRAFLAITDSRVDLSPGKDIACNQMINFLVRPDEHGIDRLNMTVTNRSNDCFVYETKIPLLDGTEWEIGKLSEEKKDEQFWVYSNDGNGNFVPGLAHHPRFVKEVTELIEVTLDNGCTERCTPEHLWMLRDGTYCEAQHLKEGHSLMPLYRRLEERGYEQILDLNSNKYKNTHTQVNKLDTDSFEKVKERVYREERLKRLVTHHKDFKKRNNCPENLQWMGWDEHRKYHQDNIADFNKLLWSSPDYEESRARIRVGQIKGVNSRFSKKEAREFQAEVMRRSNEKMWSRSGFKEAIKKVQSENGTRVLTKLWENQEYRDKMSELARKRLLEPKRNLETRERLRIMNRDEEFKKKQKKGREEKRSDPEYAKYISEIYKSSRTELSRLASIEQTNKLNSDVNNRVKAAKGKILKILDFIFENNIELSPDTYDEVRLELCWNAASCYNIFKYNIKEHQVFNKFPSVKFEEELIQKTELKKKISKESTKTRNVKNSPWTKESWGDPEYREFIVSKQKQGWENKREVKSLVNHKIKSVKRISVESTPVYDLTVDKHHNFALSSGVHVHNCFWGYSGINFYEFSFLQEFVANLLGVKLGYYLHNSMSFHIYEQHWDRVDSIISEGNRESLFPVETNTKCPEVHFSSLEEFDYLFSAYKGAIESLNSGTNTFDVWNNFRESLNKDYTDSYIFFEIPILYLCLKDQLFAFDEKVQSYISNKYYKEESLFFTKISKKFKKRIERHNYAKP